MPATPDTDGVLIRGAPSALPCCEVCDRPVSERQAQESAWRNNVILCPKCESEPNDKEVP